MKKVAIIKTGDTSPELAAERGDFEDWIIAGMGLPADKFAVVDVCRDVGLPARDTLAGVVITGSHAMVTDGDGWSRRVQAWLPGIVSRQVPVLGICYGHQLLAQALGGRVGDNPRGMEFGTVPVELIGRYAQDPLLGGLANPIHVHVCHTQTVLELPPGAQLLARSAEDPHQAFFMGESAWGLQFHPEFNALAMSYYIRQYRRELSQQGRDVDRLLAQTRETSWGDKILRRFGAVTRGAA